MEKIVPVNIEDEMKRSYLDYAMSVNVGRALPDVRDGLKPVHRRILYAMKEIGLYHNKPFRKCASIVGEVLGKYHPHGDTAVYDALVRMAQEFSLRCPLIQGQGNFGSIDGDAAAAYRYTEARLSEVAESILVDIEKETVLFTPNFDGRLKEPRVLPSKFPNLLVNGSAGIGVAMATNIPPHNLGEVVDALCALIDNPELEEFSGYIKGPDFPTGGIIAGKGNIRNAYKEGVGKITLKAVADIEPLKGGRKAIYIKEIPYQVNKSQLIERIAELVRIKKLEGISDIRDESDKRGIRVVIELKKEAREQVILNRLFKLTALKTVYGIIFLALKGGIPKIMSLKEMLQSFLDHRYEVVRRRTEFNLNKAEKRAHILEGLKIALTHIDEVIKIIKKSKIEVEAKDKLMSKFKLSDIQAQAILDMKLSRLVGLEREKLDKEYLEIIKLIEKLKRILASKKGILRVVKNELIEIKDKFKTPRKTKIVATAEKELEIEDLIPNEPTIITLTQGGYIKRSKSDVYSRQHRGGVGVIGITLAPEDEVSEIFQTKTHSSILFFTNQGRCFSKKAYNLPGADRSGRGKALVNFLQLREGEEPVTCLPAEDFEGAILMVTKKGVVKKIKLSNFERIRKTGIIALRLRRRDSIVAVTHIIPKGYIFLISKNGQVIKFKEKLLRPLSRVSQGVRGIRLKAKDEVIRATTLVNEKLSLCFITPKGHGKRVYASRFRLTNRGGTGVIGYKGELAGCTVVDDKSEILIITQNAQTLRTRTKTIRPLGRTARGVRLIKLRKGDKVIDIRKIHIPKIDKKK